MDKHADQSTSARGEAALRTFFQDVWRRDVRPLLRNRQAAQRRTLANVGGQAAAATGALLDGVFRLRGRPFTRSLTILGASFGAMLPDAWDWGWWRHLNDSATREAVTAEVKTRAADLPEAAALALFGLTPDATQDDLREAWHAACLRWHPDRARTDEQRREHHLRFLAIQAAYARLQRAYADGRLPRN